MVDNNETYMDVRVNDPTSWVPRQIFIKEKPPNIKFQTNPSSGRRGDTGGQDEQDDGNRRFSRLSERGYW